MIPWKQSSGLTEQEWGMPAPPVWQHRQMVISLSGRQHRLSRVHVKQQQQQQKMGTGERKNSAPRVQSSALISGSQVPWVPRERYSTTSHWSLPCADTQSSGWASCRLQSSIFWLWLFLSNTSSEEPRVQLNLSPALQIKRWMISTTVTCTSHCNSKCRHSSRLRVLVHNDTTLVMQLLPPPAYGFSLMNFQCHSSHLIHSSNTTLS